MSDTAYPLQLFRFHVEFERVALDSGTVQGTPNICKGAFSECSGLEATMEPKVIKAGGWNYGTRQRSGPVTFGTVILKRGITTSRDLWKWFSEVSEKGRFAYRLNVVIHVAKPGESLPGEENSGNQSSQRTLKIRLQRALPIKFKCADLNARATDVSIEELHLAHEGLILE
jgi:phage tail-like protein